MRVGHVALFLCCMLLVWQPGRGSEETYVEVQGPTISPDGETAVFNLSRFKASGSVVSGAVTLLDLRTRSTKELLHTERTDTKKAAGQLVKYPVPYAAGWYGFSWSPDGRAIFAAVIEGVAKGWAIWKLPVERGKAKRICKLARGLCQRPRVSPRGRWIVFYDAMTHELFGVSPDGTRMKRLTRCGDIYRVGYDWSPDGKHIYFSRGYMRDDDVRGIWKMYLNGTRKTLVLENYFARNVAVSPSGKYLALSLERAGQGEKLFAYRLGDEKPTMVSEKAQIFFSWHPRLDVLLYADEKGLCEWRASTGSSRRLLSAEMTYFPVATPDGKTILFLKKEGRSTFLWKLDAASERTERLFPPV